MPLNRRLFLGSLSASIVSLPLPGHATEEPAKDAKPEAPAAPDGFRLVEARKVSLQIRPAPTPATEVFGFDGGVPGPLLRFKKGEEVKIRLSNRLDSPITIHWHGVRVPNAMDGVANLTQPPVAPQQSFDYRFTPPDSGLFWYHPASLPMPEGQQDHGLYGAFIVDEAEPPKVDADRLVILDDWRLDEKGIIAAEPKASEPKASAPTPASTTSFVTMNGTTEAREETLPPASRIRLRLLSAASERLLLVSINGVKLQVIGIDGQPCEPFEPSRQTIPLTPGARFDVVFDLPPEENAEASVLLRSGNGGTDQTLLIFKTKGDKRADLGALPVLPRNPLLPTGIHLEKSTKVDLVIEGGPVALPAGASAPPIKAPDAKPDPKKPDPKVAAKTSLEPAKAAGPFKINGVVVNARAEKPLFSVKRGSAVTLGFVNKTPFIQVFHVHGYAFRLLHDLDDGWEPYWRDSLLVPEGRTKHIAFIADNPGKWLIESAIAPFASAGLATWFEVT